MLDYCRQSGLRRPVPAEWHWAMALAHMPLLFIILLGVPTANILHRAGHNLYGGQSALDTASKPDQPVGVCIHTLAERR